ncbi:DUF6879 family protein [Actinocorallia sp. A-T 12471]|uniref:DUF6879 family protein n=1 Tax=Actinocorallia sp. A-T 12471 TaxID=3089813 RepID=UPI0029CD6B45|nr:DUF6879 family protein [Actinocorallia sp. A-T 12471]MDX6739812.1 hypothetical protein [Actinocorallia sp. A-T 12471]
MDDDERTTPPGPRRGAADGGVGRRVAVSVVLGLFSFGAAVVVDRAAIDDVTVGALILAVLIGGIGFLVQLLVEFEQRLESVERRDQRAQAELAAGVRSGFAELTGVVEDRFAQSTRASRLLGAVRASAVDDGVVTRLLDNTAMLGVPAPPLVKAMAEAEINRASRFIQQLIQGEVVYADGEDQDWLLGLTRNIAVSLDATSTSLVDGVGTSFDGGFWTSGLGQRYLKAQDDAVERGVRIRRLFIMRDYAEFTSPDFLPIAQLQINAGIQVRALQHDQVPRPLRSSLIDFILFDDAIRYEVIPDPSAPGEFLKTHLTSEPTAVHERRQRFERLWDLAERQDRERREREGELYRGLDGEDES